MEKTHISCQLCPEDGVISCHGGTTLCLLHYYTTYADDTGNNSAQIISEITFNEQKDKVEFLWKEAISEVVLRMLELEKLDQQQLDEDPLSILSLNAPRLTSNISLERQKSTDSSRIKKRRIDSTSVISSSSTLSDPLHESDERESSHTKGSRCINCHSDNTYLEYGNNNWSASGRDTISTKAETWAFKDSPSAITDDYTYVKNICYDCGYETIE